MREYSRFGVPQRPHSGPQYPMIRQAASRKNAQPPPTLKATDEAISKLHPLAPS